MLSTARPRLTPEAMVKLSEFYRDLRENYCTCAQRSAYHPRHQDFSPLLSLTKLACARWYSHIETQPVPKAYRKCCVKCKMKCSHLKSTLKML